MSKSLSILFICTKFGGRSALAAHLCNQLSPWGTIAEASSFEPGRLPQGYFSLMRSLGYQIPVEQPIGLFERYKRGETFDYVVTMCSEEAGEQCAILSLSVKELYGKEAKLLNWSVPDLSQIGGTDSEVRRDFVQVAEDLEHRITTMIRDLQQENGRCGAGTR